MQYGGSPRYVTYNENNIKTTHFNLGLFVHFCYKIECSMKYNQKYLFTSRLCCFIVWFCVEARPPFWPRSVTSWEWVTFNRSAYTNCLINPCTKFKIEAKHVTKTSAYVDKIGDTVVFYLTMTQKSSCRMQRNVSEI